MRRIVIAGLFTALYGLGAAGAARADGPAARCADGMVDGVFVVCGERTAPRAVYVLPRSRSERDVPELRRTFTDEIVRAGADL